MSCTYRIDIQYDGTEFLGWQKQPQGLSVEEALQRAYCQFLNEDVFIDGSGRTDAGVHARHQIGILVISRNLPDKALVEGVKPYLPEGVTVFHCQRVNDDWKPRPVYQREYRYFLWKGKTPPIFLRYYCSSYQRNLCLSDMLEAASMIPGERDYSTFRGAGCTARHPIRRVDSVMVYDQGTHWEFRVLGNAFLRQMVRIMVGTLVWIGEGKCSPKQMDHLIKQKNRAMAGPTMPPQGLFLWQIRMSPDEILEIPHTLWEIPMTRCSL